MSAKPSSLPTYLSQLPKPVPPKPLLPQQITYNDQFAQFLSSSKKPETAATSVVVINTPTLVNPSNITAKVIVQPSQPPPLALSINKPTQLTALVNKSPTPVTPTQKKQEEWTQMVLTQSQKTTSAQKVKTERIQPYVQGQSQLYANQIQGEGGQKVYYTIMNSSPTAQPRVTVANVQGYEQKQSSC